MFLFLNFYGQIEKCKNKLINPRLKNIFKFVIILMNWKIKLIFFFLEMMLM